MNIQKLNELKNLIMKANYQEALTLTKEIFGNDKNYREDKNIFLWLLSFLTELPEEYQNLIHSMTYFDFVIFDNNEAHSNIDLRNSFSLAIINQQFVKAIKIINKLLFHNLTITKELDEIIKSLLSRVITERKSIEYYLNSLIQDKKYDTAIQYLENMRNRQRLNRDLIYILKLLYDLKNIREKHIIPKKTEKDIDYFSGLLDGNSYESALAVLNSREERFAKDFPNNVFKILLEEIIKELAKIPEIEKEEVEWKDNYDEMFLDGLFSQMDELQEKGILILNPESEEINKRMARLTLDVDGIKTFLIGGVEEQLMVLPRTLGNYSFEFRKIMKRKSHEAFKNYDYEECIEICKDLLRHGYPEAVDLLFLGISQIRANNLELGIKYIYAGCNLLKFREKESRIAKKTWAYWDYEEMIKYFQDKILKPNLVDEYTRKIK